jgi:S-DNA-T family DNA segregation ATPase FtsK/SpoIIIE
MRGRRVGVIRGDLVPDAAMLLQSPVMIRTPVVRVPLWLMVTGWCLKGLGWVLLVLVRWWYVTGPVLAAVWLWWRFGWQAPATVAGGMAAGLGWWGWWHPGSFRRWCWWPVLARWRRWRYRRSWQAAMAVGGLLVRFDGREVAPVLRRVTCRAGVDVLLVRMVTGQLPEDFSTAAERLAQSFGARSVRVRPHPRRTGLVTLTAVRRDPLTRVVGPLPVTARPDYTALPLGLCEDGTPYALRLFGTQVLVAGATGSGKGSVIWSLIAALAGGIGTGLVRLWGFDPKGGMELGPGMSLFDQLACDDYEAMAELLDHAVHTARARAGRLRGHTRQHIPSVAEPLIVLVVDELAALTGYLADRKLKERIRASLGVLLSQGRAVGVHVLAAIQDPRKEVLPFRDLFPTRIGLRLTEASQTDLVLGDGMRQRGAACERIPQGLPGVGYVVLDGDPTPARVRFSYHSDDQIRDMAATYGRLHVIEGHTVPDTDTHPGRWAA